MFTGIIEAAGKVLSLHKTEAGGQLRLAAPGITLATGESLAVNGCCLTLTRTGEAGEFEFDLLGETLERTTLGALLPGDTINLERAMAANGRFGGHLVQGHIDCTGEVKSVENRGADRRIEVSFPPEFSRYIVFKGSIALDGVSLTVAEAVPGTFAVWIIPHTLAVTTLGARKKGDRVNLEFDLVAKYVVGNL